MARHHGTVRRSYITLLGALTLTATLLAPTAPAAVGAALSRVRTVTHGTVGHALEAIVDAVHDGDLLPVRGTCRRSAAIDTDPAIRGVGDGGRGRTAGIAHGAHEAAAAARGPSPVLREAEIRPILAACEADRCWRAPSARRVGAHSTCVRR